MKEEKETEMTGEEGEDSEGKLVSEGTLEVPIVVDELKQTKTRVDTPYTLEEMFLSGTVVFPESLEKVMRVTHNAARMMWFKTGK